MERSPREDKDRDLARRSVSGARHALRKQQARIKAAAHRRYRRAQTQALAQAGSLADTGAADTAEARIATTRRELEPHWGSPPTLADHVTDRLVERFIDMVDTYSAGAYNPVTQRARTEAALTEITRARPGGRRTSAVMALDALLPEPVFPGRHWYRHPARVERRGGWFAAFLDDRPDWEPRLVRFIADRAAG